MKLFKDEESRKKVIDQIFAEQKVKDYIGSEQADEMELWDWIIKFRDQVETLRKADPDDLDTIFKTYLQILHYSKRAAISLVRQGLDDQAA